MKEYTPKWNFHHRLDFPHNEVCKKPTSILPSCSPWQRLTSQPIFDCAMICDVVSPKDGKRCGSAVFTPVWKRRWKCFVVLLFGANCVLIFTMLRCSATGCVNYSDESFTCRPSARSDSRSGYRGWGERMSLLVVARACAPSMLTKIAMKQGHCWEESLLVAMEVTWESQGGLRRRLPSPRGLPTYSLSRVAMLAQCQLDHDRGKEKSTSVIR